MINKKPDITIIINSLITFSLTLALFSAVLLWQWPDQYLHIVICDVGQGDAILLTQGFSQLLVDAGLREEDVLHCLRNQLPFWDRQIEWIVPTHLDADHIGGFAGVLDRYHVKNMLLPKDTKQSTDFEQFNAAVLREVGEGGVVHTPTIGAPILIVPTWKLTVIYTPTETQLWDAKAVKILDEFNPKESNNRSTVLSLVYGQVSLLLTGDLESPIEQALIAHSMVTQHTLLKVGHHGSKSSSSEQFVRLVRPEIGLVSVGKNNQYGHPSPMILERLRQFGVEHILRTDQQGSIVLKTDGQQVWWMTNGEQKTLRTNVSGTDSANQRGE